MKKERIWPSIDDILLNIINIYRVEQGKEVQEIV